MQRARMSRELAEMMRSKTVEGLMGAASVARVADLRSLRLSVRDASGEWSSCTLRTADAVNIAQWLLEASAMCDSIGSGRAGDMLRICGLDAKGWVND